MMRLKLRQLVESVSMSLRGWELQFVGVEE